MLVATMELLSQATASIVSPFGLGVVVFLLQNRFRAGAGAVSEELAVFSMLFV